MSLVADRVRGKIGKKSERQVFVRNEDTDQVIGNEVVEEGTNKDFLGVK